MWLVESQNGTTHNTTDSMPSTKKPERKIFYIVLIVIIMLVIIGLLVYLAWNTINKRKFSKMNSTVASKTDLPEIIGDGTNTKIKVKGRTLEEFQDEKPEVLFDKKTNLKL